MVYYSKMKETKRKIFGDGMKKKKEVKEGFHFIFKSEEHEFVLFIFIHQHGLGGAEYILEERKRIDMLLFLSFISVFNLSLSLSIPDNDPNHQRQNTSNYITLFR